jgi:hypothetical protein
VAVAPRAVRRDRAARLRRPFRLEDQQHASVVEPERGGQVDHRLDQPQAQHLFVERGRGAHFLAYRTVS